MGRYKVYMHTNNFNDMRYIGITSLNVHKRWHDGEGYKGSYFYKEGIAKAGWQNFRHEIVYGNLTKEEAECIETELIYKYRTYIGWDDCWGYNATKGNKDILKIQNIKEEESRELVDSKIKVKPIFIEDIKKKSIKKCTIDGKIFDTPSKLAVYLKITRAEVYQILEKPPKEYVDRNVAYVRNKSNKKKCTIDGKIFDTPYKLAVYLGITKRQVYQLLEKPPKEYLQRKIGYVKHINKKS